MMFTTDVLSLSIEFSSNACKVNLTPPNSTEVFLFSSLQLSALRSSRIEHLFESFQYSLSPLSTLHPAASYKSINIIAILIIIFIFGIASTAATATNTPTTITITSTSVKFITLTTPSATLCCIYLTFLFLRAYIFYCCCYCQNCNYGYNTALSPLGVRRSSREDEQTDRASKKRQKATARISIQVIPVGTLTS
ncbi:unnamed protein product [Acanthosepion pharaonis]|uniref:Uncharacterized protein n=1 Tax=Acanthosepion pharaonis TaxID=158019 RepID=A0A812BS70_ACAPH|nr:unnamed protein product [Sepia pharaonis]